MMEAFGKLLVTSNIFNLMVILCGATVVWELGYTLIFLLRCFPTFNAIKTLKKYQSHNKYQKYQTLQPSINWIKKYLAGSQQGRNYIVKMVDYRFVLLDYPKVLEIERNKSTLKSNVIKKIRNISISVGFLVILQEIIVIITRVNRRFYSQVGVIPKDQQVLNFLSSFISSNALKNMTIITICIGAYLLLTLIFSIFEILRDRLRLVLRKRLDVLVIIQLRSQFQYRAEDD